MKSIRIKSNSLGSIHLLSSYVGIFLPGKSRLRLNRMRCCSSCRVSFLFSSSVQVAAADAPHAITTDDGSLSLPYSPVCHRAYLLFFFFFFFFFFSLWRKFQVLRNRVHFNDSLDRKIPPSARRVFVKVEASNVLISRVISSLLGWSANDVHANSLPGVACWAPRLSP